MVATVLTALSPGTVRAQRAPVVLAAASMQEALTAAADAFARTGQPRPVLSFAASSALARQIIGGAPADLFVSADEPWMDQLAARGLIAPRSRATLVSNRLVLVAGRGFRGPLVIRPRFPLAQALGSGRLAIGDPAGVPAGRYARAALQRLGVWASLADRLAPAESVRAALALVERGAAPLGIVYATDVREASGVRVIGTFPAASHPPIRYPIARVARSANPAAERFRRFLLGREARAIFRRHGFLDPA
ncbi:molybdate transport system substrate-binding protein [Sphingomonas jejuensis]|uniref:Molybdate transport system substrate-binding protein n=1 Tax=Sphingomonas jejuensis TaxID=904715 RepID=A0ABX0XLG0_9SPHN|nr:molybdate ABC transporter substrate-binding protein [Sphingomonas jejuensis]NJC34203.1 molybdate transport system substrate-binding protein [Sphingomonas jejuensis]